MEQALISSSCLIGRDVPTKKLVYLCEFKVAKLLETFKVVLNLEVEYFESVEVTMFSACSMNSGMVGLRFLWMVKVSFFAGDRMTSMIQKTLDWVVKVC